MRQSRIFLKESMTTEKYVIFDISRVQDTLAKKYFIIY